MTGFFVGSGGGMQDWFSNPEAEFCEFKKLSDIVFVFAFCSEFLTEFGTGYRNSLFAIFEKIFFPVIVSVPLG
jgi:hypothetical protein